MADDVYQFIRTRADGTTFVTNASVTIEEGQRRWPGSVPDMRTGRDTGGIADGIVAAGQGMGEGQPGLLRRLQKTQKAP